MRETPVDLDIAHAFARGNASPEDSDGPHVPSRLSERAVLEILGHEGERYHRPRDPDDELTLGKASSKIVTVEGRRVRIHRWWRPAAKAEI